MLTVAKVAERLSISKQIVYALVEAGQLPAHRFGLGRGTIRISEEDLAEYVSSCLDHKTERAPKPARRRFRNLTL